MYAEYQFISKFILFHAVV